MSGPIRSVPTNLPLPPQTYDPRDQAELRRMIERAFEETNNALDGFATGYANLTPDWDNDDVIVEIGASDLDTAAAYFEVSLEDFVEPTKDSTEVLGEDLPYIEPAGLEVEEGDTVYLWVKFWSTSQGFGQSVKTTLTRQTIPPSEIIPSIVIDSEEEVGDEAIIGILLSDPAALATRVEFRYRVGFKGEWESGDTEEELVSAWTLRVARPFGLGEPYPGTPEGPLNFIDADYPIVVPIVDYPPTFVEIRLEYEWQGAFFYTSPIISSGFDTGKLSTLAASVVLDKDWNASVQVQGDFDTKSIKIGFVKGDDVSDSDLTAEDIDERDFINGRVFSVETVNAEYTDIPVSLDEEERVIFGIVGYNEEDGDGDPSPPVYVRAERPKIEIPVPEPDVEIQSVLWQPDTGESGGTSIIDAGGGANRVAVWTARFSERVRSYKIIVGPFSSPSGSPVEANYYTAFTGPGLQSDFIRNLNTGGELGAQNALQFPGSYDVNSTFQIQAFESEDATGVALGDDSVLLRLDDPLNLNYYVSGTTVVEGQALRAGSGIDIALVDTMPQISINPATLSLQLGDIKDGGSGTGTGRLVVGTASGADTIPGPSAAGQVLKAKTSGASAEYEWGEVTAGVTSVGAGAGLSGGGTGAVTLNVNAYSGAAANRGQTAIESDSVSVVLGTGANTAAAGNHTHPASDIVSGTLDTARIPNLDAGKITTGTFNDARIPNLAASKITSGTFDTARIPNLDANKITSGTLDNARLNSAIADVTVAGGGPTGNPPRAGSLWFVV